VFPVVSGQTMELAIAQFWSSGLGSREPTIVDFEVGTENLYVRISRLLRHLHKECKMLVLCFVLSFGSSCVK